MFKKYIGTVVIGLFIVIGLLGNTKGVEKVNDYSKPYYKERLMDRAIMRLRKPIGLDTTSVEVDYILVGMLDRYVTMLDDNCVDTSRLLDLDFVAYDYIPRDPSNPFSAILGFQQSLTHGPDYIIINSHAGMSPRVLEVVVYHELTHHMRNDGFHCNSIDCSLIMAPGINEKIADSIYADHVNQIKLLIKDLPKCD